MWEAVNRLLPPPLAITYGRVVNDGIESTQSVDLLRDVTGGLDTGKIPDDDAFSAWNRGAGIKRPLLVPGMQEDLMALLNHELGGHPAQPIRGAGDKDSCHASIVIRLQLHSQSGIGG